MNQLQDRIAQFRKMTNDDPDNHLGHYGLGQLLQEEGNHEEAAQALRRALDLSPQISKAYQLLAVSLMHLQQREEAVKVLRQGFSMAEERGDNVPREEMARMLTQLGETMPVSKAPTATNAPASGDGFRCQRPGCFWGARARRLPGPPITDEVGQRIFETVCQGCWNDWLRNYSIKVINELHLDLSMERGQQEYDRHMKEFFGLE